MKAKKRGKEEEGYKGIALNFVTKHGEDVWELEALSPATLQDVLREAIDAVIDPEAFNYEVEQEKADAAKLTAVRRVVFDTLGDWRGDYE